MISLRQPCSTVLGAPLWRAGGVLVSVTPPPLRRRLRFTPRTVRFVVAAGLLLALVVLSLLDWVSRTT
jgi:hypothetical protein